jgi:hypothetical protein
MSSRCTGTKHRFSNVVYDLFTSPFGAWLSIIAAFLCSLASKKSLFFLLDVIIHHDARLVSQQRVCLDVQSP